MQKLIDRNGAVSVNINCTDELLQLRLGQINVDASQGCIEFFAVKTARLILVEPVKKVHETLRSNNLL